MPKNNNYDDQFRELRADKKGKLQGVKPSSRKTKGKTSNGGRKQMSFGEYESWLESYHRDKR